MNELFRAKNLKDEWVYGYYSEYCDVHVINYEHSSSVIKPETLAMWTGFEDKEGTYIYGSVTHIFKESRGGDIVRFPGTKELKSFFVNYERGMYLFDCENPGLTTPWYHIHKIVKDSKVIGNLIDTPELGE